MEPSVNKHMLFDHFAGNSTPLQKRLIEEWLQEAANQELFYYWLAQWEQQSPQYLPELDNKLASFVQAIHSSDQTLNTNNDQTLLTPNPPSRNLWIRWFVAASILVLAGTWAWLSREKLLYQSYQTRYAETRSIRLADGSAVTLNANSNLLVPRFGFGQKTRKVLLRGEAAFSVRHTRSNQQFIVGTDRHFDVVVWGTEFTVYSRQRGGKVVLDKGKVELRYQDGAATRQMFMKPGDLVIFDRQNHLKQSSTDQPQKHAAWKEHQFVFDSTSLREFSAILLENFGVSLIINDEALAKRTLEGSFHARSADELLNAVSEVFDLDVLHSGNKLLLIEKE